MKRSTGRLSVALLLAGLAGCGFSSGLRIPEHYESVGIQVFGNDTLEIDVEQELHEQLSTQVNELVQAPLASPAVADVVLDGVVIEYTRRGGIRDPLDNSLLESALVVRAEGWLVDRLTGDRIGEPARASSRIGYVVTERQGEAQARFRALRDVAQRLVLDLFSDLD